MQRSHDGSTDFVVSKIQTEDLEMDEMNEVCDILKNNEKLVQENRKLRAMNKQVYEVALSIREKCKS